MDETIEGSQKTDVETFAGVEGKIGAKIGGVLVCSCPVIRFISSQLLGQIITDGGDLILQHLVEVILRCSIAVLMRREEDVGNLVPVVKWQ